MEECERARLQILVQFERDLWKKGFKQIAGIDEAGRGPLAGPVVAAACVIPKGIVFEGVDDSKKLTDRERRFLFDKISTHSDVQFGIGIVEPKVIDEINIYQATIRAMLMALEAVNADYLLVDGLKLPHPTLPVEKIIKGDSKSHAIAAASVIAKVTRDNIMLDHHSKWPQYGFNSHKGYGTKKHLDALQLHGPIEIHRFSFGPVKSCVIC